MNQTNHTVYFKTRDEVTKVRLSDVMYVINDGNYIILKFKSGRTATLLASLGNFITLTEGIPGIRFERIGRSHAVNIAYVSQVNVIRKTITLVDDDMKERMEIVVSKESVRQLKSVITSMPHIAISDFKTINGSMEAFQVR